ncbi:hypothetical protein BH09PSE2_BH09PSE2_11370 [soil metagenome]
MKRLRSAALAGAAFAFLSAGGASAQSVAVCAWAQTPPQARQAFMEAYALNPARALKLLSTRAPQMAEFVATCAATRDVPPAWSQAAIVSQARQDGALYVLSGSKGIDRTALDRAWNTAPPAARQCARATASHAFGLNEVCADATAPIGFLTPLNLSLRGADRAASQQALAYFTAKAQGEWADALIAKVKVSGPPPAAAARPGAPRGASKRPRQP